MLASPRSAAQSRSMFGLRRTPLWLKADVLADAAFDGHAAFLGRLVDPAGYCAYGGPVEYARGVGFDDDHVANRAFGRHGELDVHPALDVVDNGGLRILRAEDFERPWHARTGFGGPGGGKCQHEERGQPSGERAGVGSHRSAHVATSWTAAVSVIGITSRKVVPWAAALLTLTRPLKMLVMML